MLPAFGIANEVRAEARLQSQGSAAEHLRSGETDIAIQQISELLAEDGVTVRRAVISTYSSAITTGAVATASARELIDFLNTPATRAVFRAKGMDAAPVP